jgi:hypothetical protein
LGERNNWPKALKANWKGNPGVIKNHRTNQALKKSNLKAMQWYKLRLLSDFSNNPLKSSTGQKAR